MKVGAAKPPPKLESRRASQVFASGADRRRARARIFAERAGRSRNGARFSLETERSPFPKQDFDRARDDRAHCRLRRGERARIFEREAIAAADEVAKSLGWDHPDRARSIFEKVGPFLAARHKISSGLATGRIVLLRARPRSATLGFSWLRRQKSADRGQNPANFLATRPRRRSIRFLLRRCRPARHFPS
jgi:hypothetical protein